VIKARLELKYKKDPLARYNLSSTCLEPKKQKEKKLRNTLFINQRK